MAKPSTSSAHTPGPWYRYDDGTADSSSDIIMANRNHAKVDIAIMASDDATAVPIEERKANACLIAACPDMKIALEAIKNDCADWLDDELDMPASELFVAIGNAAETAIAKAELDA